jgi:microcystin-dependent protein
MAIVRPKARILERSITSGNGPYTLGGAVDGSYNTFASFMAIGDTTFATVVEPGVAFWSGYVTYSATNQLTLTTVEEIKGTFGAGTKEIFTAYPASRGMFPEDIAGAIVTGGTSTAYTVASYRKYDTLARLDGNIIAFTPHATNGQTVTLNVDGLGNKPLRPSPGVELQSNSLIQGTPYLALYNHTDDAFYLHGMGGNTYGIPLGVGMDYWGATTPSSAFAFPIGQALSRTTYAKLFALIGTTYGAGDGSTTFNLPDKTGRVSAMKEGSASRLTSTYFGGNSAALGGVGGGESETLSIANINPFTPTGTAASVLTSNIQGSLLVNTTGGANTPTGGSAVSVSSFVNVNQSVNTTITMNSLGSGAPHRTVQPTIVCNYIMRVL